MGGVFPRHGFRELRIGLEGLHPLREQRFLVLTGRHKGVVGSHKRVAGVRHGSWIQRLQGGSGLILLRSLRANSPASKISGTGKPIPTASVVLPSTKLVGANSHERRCRIVALLDFGDFEFTPFISD